MPKNTTSYVCQECGYDSPQWLGKCPECGLWNSLKEFILNKGQVLSNYQKNLNSTVIKPKILSEINLDEVKRIPTGYPEMDNVLGGGIVPGSVSLLAGDPGIGKSTLLLQLCLNISDRGRKVLYISAEESVEQIKLRALRVTKKVNNPNFLLLSLSNVDTAVSVISKEKPSLVVIDSIQTFESEALTGLSGSVGQVRYAATQLIRVGKVLSIPIIIVGHVTKEGMVAGPMVLSHMVDTVIFLEGEKFTKTRILRSLKNRFGPVDEVGIFVMEGEGMNEVQNPEQLFLTKRDESVPGSVLVVILEGTRPFLIEIQALVVYSKLAMPRRVSSGIDHKRLELLIAVLQKQCRLTLDNMDVFVNVAGGLKVSDPAIDLAICLAIYSSIKNKSLNNIVGIAEVGLLGELRNVGGIDKRLKEAKKLGFQMIMTSQTHKNLELVLKDIGWSNDNKTALQIEHEKDWKLNKRH